jgi:hypothetical protein
MSRAARSTESRVSSPESRVEKLNPISQILNPKNLFDYSEAIMKEFKTQDLTPLSLHLKKNEMSRADALHRVTSLESRVTSRKTKSYIPNPRMLYYK